MCKYFWIVGMKREYLSKANCVRAEVKYSKDNGGYVLELKCVVDNGRLYSVVYGPEFNAIFYPMFFTLVPAKRRSQKAEDEAEEIAKKCVESKVAKYLKRIDGTIGTNLSFCDKDVLPF